jgi:DNA repair protein RadC
MNSQKYHIPVIKLLLVREGDEGDEAPQITSPMDASLILGERMRDLPSENLVAMYLDTKNRVMGIETVAVGGLNCNHIEPREVFRGALVANAAAIIIAHNHPSGDTSPSPEDLGMTQKLVHVGELLGVPVLDHIIVGIKCLSLRERYPDIWSETRDAKERL